GRLKNTNPQVLTITHREMLRYLVDFAAHFGLDSTIECSAEVTKCRPLGFAGDAGWEVEINSKETRRYAAVVSANGHHWSPNIPVYEGTFTGRMLHSYDYKRPDDFGSGGRVLVVGAGNSACDLAVEAAQTFGHADISMRGGYWFFPKLIFGVPSANLTKWPIPSMLQKPFVRGFLAIAIGDTSRYGLPRPDHRLYSKDITVNTTMLNALRHGRVSYRPAIERIDDGTVSFVDGTNSEYDTVVWATGYHTVFPFLDTSVLRMQDGYPVLIKTIFVPGFSNIYIAGAATIRAVGGDVLPSFGRLIADAIAVQRLVKTPIGAALNYFLPATNESLVGGASDVKPLLLLGTLALRVVRFLSAMRYRWGRNRTDIAAPLAVSGGCDYRQEFTSSIKEIAV
ncbi:flavin-containing monooxygenase, partial [Mycobacteroides immunogenum]